MCGRFTQSAPSALLLDYFGLAEIPELEPRYNIAPTQPVAAIFRSPDRPKPQFKMMKWGLVPSWAKTPSKGPPLINARCETAAEKPAFRVAFKSRRCLIAADGFYEWLRYGKGEKRPYYIQLEKPGPFAFAGLWELWKGPSEEILSCTILTTAANPLIRNLHDRMPVILRPEAHSLWLDPSMRDAASLQILFASYPADEMKMRAVGPHVNNAAHQGPQCVESL